MYGKEICINIYTYTNLYVYTYAIIHMYIHIKTSVSWCLTWFANRWTIEATQELDPDIQVASMGGEMMEKSCGRILWRSNISHDPFSLSSTSNFQICWPSCSYVKNRKGKFFSKCISMTMCRLMCEPCTQIYADMHRRKCVGSNISTRFGHVLLPTSVRACLCENVAMVK